MSAINAHDTILHALRGALVADSATAALVSDRVRTEHAVDADAGSVTYPCVILSEEGGTAHYTGRLQAISFELWAYADTSRGEARAVYDAAQAALHMERVALTVGATTYYVVAREVGRPRGGWNESLRKHYVAGRWNAQAAW